MAWDDFNPTYYKMSDIFSPSSSGVGDSWGDDMQGDMGMDAFNPRAKKRIRDVYTPTQATPQTQPDTTASTKPQSSPEDDYMRRFNMMVDTSGPAQTAYGDYVKTTPKREDYEPSKFRRFMAALSGGAAGYRNPAEGIRVASTINDDPYNEAVGDWQTKGKGLEAAAQEERQSLTARRGLMHDILYDNLGRRKQDTAEKIAPSIIDKNEGAAAQSGAAAADTKAKTADRPAELDIKKRQAEAKIGLDDAMTNLRAAQATGEPDIIAAMKDRAKAALIAAQAAGVSAAANTVKADAAKTIADRGPAAKGQPIMTAVPHTASEEASAKSLAIQTVRDRANGKYDQFVEKDKQGGLTTKFLHYTGPSMLNPFGQDESATRQKFLDEVDAETKAILARTVKTKRTGTDYSGGAQTGVKPTRF